MENDRPEIPGYVIERVLGAGGMATVYLAIQQSFGRPVALKVISQELARNPEFGRRFLREARIVGSLSHPHIVQVHDVGEHSGVFYLAMELFTAGDLRSQIRAPLLESRALEITRQLASALGYAHQKGFVHRDIKPDNVLFRESGEAVLTDFGIARPAHGHGDLTDITQVEAVIGSPKYMSPEQSLGRALDGRSDIYSLGVMLYQMLTGEVPFAGKTLSELSLQRMEKQVPRLPDRRGHLQPLMNGMLAYEREQRFADCEALQRAICDALALGATSSRLPSRAALDATLTGDTDLTHTREQSSQTSTPRVLFRPRFVAALIVGCLAVGMALFMWQRQEPTPLDPVATNPAPLTGISAEMLPDSTAPGATRDAPPTPSPLETPPAEEFFAFSDAANTGLVERQAAFILSHPESVFADMLRVKLASDRALLAALEEQADRGDSRAQLVVSELYDTGWAGERSQARARDYARRAARGGNPFAKYHFAMLVLGAAETDAERREGIQELEQAAEAGFYLAQTVLANYLLEGRLLGSDIDAGLELLEAAGAQGDRNALFNLGRIFDSGLYIQRADPERAQGYFERAAQLGQPQARNYLNEP